MSSGTMSRVSCGRNARHRPLHGLVGFALLDALVDPVLDEQLDERLAVQFVPQLGLTDLQFALQERDQLLRVEPDHAVDFHLHGPLALDHDQVGVQGDLAVRPVVERRDRLFGVLPRGQGNDDLGGRRREVVDGPNPQFFLPDRVLDRGDDAFGRRAERDLPHDELVALALLDLGTQPHLAVAAPIVGGVHQTALGEIWHQAETFAL